MFWAVRRIPGRVLTIMQHVRTLHGYGYACMDAKRKRNQIDLSASLSLRGSILFLFFVGHSGVEGGWLWYDGLVLMVVQISTSVCTRFCLRMLKIPAGIIK